MISAVIFDLDGTLVQTEALKAESYARAAVALRPGSVDKADVLSAYDDCVGRQRDEVAQVLLDRFDLADPALARAPSLGVTTARDAFLALRMHEYESMLADRPLIQRQELHYATALLRKLKGEGYPTALTTVSHAAQAYVVLDALDLRKEFDVIVTIDDVKQPKPDPEIYLTAAARLHLPPASCLAIEDSLPGVQAAVAAGMTCVAVPSDQTRRTLLSAPPLPGVQIVGDPAQLESVVYALVSTKKEATACS